MSLTPEQLALRRTGITGTEIAALAGVHPYASPIKVYLSKTEPEGRFDAGFRADVGTAVEPLLMRWLCGNMGRTISQPGTIVHPQHPLVIATPDGISHAPNEEDMVVEAKAPGWRASAAWGEPGSDDIPDHYYTQVIWELAVTGLKVAHVVVDLGRWDPDVYVVHFSPELFDELRSMAEQFWQDHVVKGIPPEPDGGDDYAGYLKAKLRGTDRGVLLPASDAAVANAISLHHAKAQAEAAELRVQEIQQRIKSEIGEADGLEFPPGGPYSRITWKRPVDTKKTDWKKVAKAAGAGDDLEQQFTTVKENSRRIHLAEDKTYDKESK